MNLNHGDLGVYFEIDSWIPMLADGETCVHGSKEFIYLQFEFFKNKKQIWDNSNGFRVKTIRLRGALSQGWLCSIDLLNTGSPVALTPEFIKTAYEEGTDLSELLGVRKWERSEGVHLAGFAKGTFPEWGRKTDAERIQNLSEEIFQRLLDVEFEATVKRDGSSCSMYSHQDTTGVCSRNINLKVDESNADNAFVKMYQEKRVEQVLPQINKNLMMQGEMFGPGIQSNFESVDKNTFEVFNFYIVNERRDATPDERYAMINEYNAIAGEELIKNVPVIFRGKLREIGTTRKEIIEWADGPSAGAGKFREGVVFKSINLHNGNVFVMKAVSNRYLEKTGN